MKIPAIRQLPSGMFFCQLRLDGQSISITDEDPDVVEAKAYAYKAGVLKARRNTGALTIGQALDRYIRSRENISSPSTLQGYHVIKRNRFLSLQKRKISELTQAIVQREINAESAVVSAKTLKNSYSLIASAIEEAGGERFDVRLKQVRCAEKLFLTSEQIPVLLKAIKSSKYEIPILLGLWSCRRSEILGLTWDNVDLKNGLIHIEKALVGQEGGGLVEKPMPKNNSSIRSIPICAQLREALERIDDRSGRVVKNSPNAIYQAVNRICKENDLPLIGLHGLRHSFASLAYHLQIPAKTARLIGGWRNDDTMMSIYTHISQSDVSTAAVDLAAFFDSAHTQSLSETPNNR